MEKTSVVKKVFGIIGTILFFASYLPYIYVVFCGIEGVQEGLFGGAYVYGFDAMINVLTWFVVIPIVPVCFIYQLVFGIVYIRKRKALTITTLVTVAIIIVSALSIGISYESQKQRQLRADKSRIEMEITSQFDLDANSITNVRMDNYEDRSYFISVDVLPKTYKVEVFPDMYYDNNLIGLFLAHNDTYENEFEAYINSKYDLPDNMNYEVRVSNIKFGGYKDGDDYTTLFEKTSYSISGVTVNMDAIDDDTVISIVQEVWDEYSGTIIDSRRAELEEVSRNSTDDFYTIYIKVDGQFAFSINVFYSLYETEKATAYVNTYSDYKGYSKLDGLTYELSR